MTRMLAQTREPVVHFVEGSYDPEAVLVSFARQPGAFALESVCNTSGYGRYSIFGCDPLHRWDAHGKPRHDIEEALRCLTWPTETRLSQVGANLPFAGGWVGYLGYEFGACGQRGMRDETHSAFRFALYDSAAILDHQTGQWVACAVDLPESIRPAPQRVEELTNLITSATAIGDHTAEPHAPAGGPSRRPSPLITPLRPNMSKAEYLAKVRQAQAYIRAGDIYQVNLTQRFTARVNLSPLELYLRLRRANPADYAAYLPWGDEAILSCSPELFLERYPGGRVITRPIKGTIARGDDPATDGKRAAELLASDKDRAELNMIVDLLRNDLGRVCEFGTIRVRADREVEIHPTVLHLVASIEGRLRPGVSHAELLRATFPGGSITGCPKIRAMEIIRELEPTPRGAYCGAIGMIGLDGRMTLNVAIRTLSYEAGTLHLYAGGAITADSDPEAEYQECLAKAEGMFQALGCSTRDLPRDLPLSP